MLFNREILFHVWPKHWLVFFLLFNGLNSLIAAPLVTDMQPRHGRPGTRVIFTGKDLGSVTAVRFGEAYADWEPVGVIDDEGKVYIFEIHSTVPDNATTARPVLMTIFGDITMPMPYVVAPRIINFHPKRGGPGNFVTIEGENFSGVKNVKFGEIPAEFSVTASTQIRAVVPFGVTDSSKVTVSHDESATSSDSFKLIGPGPVIDWLDQWVGAPGDSVVIRGVNFIGVSNVWFGNVEASFNVVAGTQIKAVVPVGSSGAIAVASPFGLVETKGIFHITRAPVVSDLFPLVAAPGGHVQLRGVNFQQIHSVEIGDVKIAGQSTPSSKQLNFTVPLNAKTGLVKVTNKFGEGFSKEVLTVTSAPVIDSFDPIIAQKGKWVTLRGSNFIGATKVLLGDMSLKYTVTAPTQIRVDLPLNVETGNLTVNNTFGSDTAAKPLTIIGNSPYVTDIEPNRGVAGISVKLYGRNLDQTTGVEFAGGMSANFTVPASTQLNVFVPLNAHTGPIKLLSNKEEHITEEVFFMPPRLTKPDLLAAKPGDDVVFNGLNFNGLASLNIGNHSVPFEVVSNDQVRFTVGDDWVGGGIKLIAPGGSYISTNSFAVLPRIDSFDPSIGPAGTLVTIRGSGFRDIQFLKFGGGVSEFERKSAKQLLARVPPNASTGQLSIITPDGETISEEVFTATAPGDLQMKSLLSNKEYRPNQSVEIGNRLIFFGPTIATQVTVTNQLPNGVRLLAVNPEPTRMLHDGRTLVYELGQIKPGSEFEFHLKLLPLIKGKFVNVINAVAYEGDVVPTNNGAVNNFLVYDPSDIKVGITSDGFGRTFTLSWVDLGLPLKVETCSFMPGGDWRLLPFEPWSIGGRTFVTLEKFGSQSYFRLRLDLDAD